MNTRHYLMFDGTTYAIWESEPSGSGIRELQEKKPWFEIIGKARGYETRAEAEAERQRLEDSE